MLGASSRHHGEMEVGSKAGERENDSNLNGRETERMDKAVKDKRRRGEMNERKGKKTVRVQFVQHICRFQILRL